MANHRMDVTSDMAAAFYGSDHMNVDFLLAEIVDLLNYHYAVADARHDIIDYYLMEHGDDDD